MKAALVMFKPDGERRDFPVSKPIVVLGRKHTCDLRIPLSSVSREHAQVERRPDGFYIRDLGSSNGTYHNERRVHEHKLEPGDAIVIGPVHFTVVIDGRPRVVEPVATVLPEGSRVMQGTGAGGSRSGRSSAGGSAEGSRRPVAGAGTAKERAAMADPSKGKVAERPDEQAVEAELIEAMEIEFEDAEDQAIEEGPPVKKDRPETPAEAASDADQHNEASPDAPTGIPGGERDGASDPIAALESLASAPEDEERPERRSRADADKPEPEPEPDADDDEPVRLREEEDDRR